MADSAMRLISHHIGGNNSLFTPERKIEKHRGGITLVFAPHKDVHKDAPAITIRIDADIKRQFDTLCQDFRMSANTAFNIFARSVVRSRSIPFEIQADSKESIAAKAREAVLKMREISEANGNSEMTLDEINDEIQASRTQI